METRIDRKYFFVRSLHVASYLYMIIAVIIFIKTLALVSKKISYYYTPPPKGEGGILFYLCPSVLPSVQDIFRRIFLSNC